MSEPETPMTAVAAGRVRLRTSRADREQAIEVLKAAFVQGRLTKDEFEARVGRALTSRTYAELAAVTTDIPAGLTDTQQLYELKPPRRPARPWIRVRMNTAVTGGACVILAAHVGIVAAMLAGNGLAVLVVAVLIVVASAVAIGAMLIAR